MIGTGFSGEGRRGPLPAPGDGPIFAALDLGTNNCRLLVARPAGETFRVIDAFSRIVRLGERLAATGELGMPAMDRTVEALAVCAAKLRRRGVTLYRGVATEACRRARNGAAFVSRVTAETGLALEIIEAREEADLALAGCAPLLDRNIPHAILFDIGGGSTEVTWLAFDRWRWQVVDSLSLGLGVVVLSDRLGQDRVPPELYAEVVEETARRLAAFEAAHGIREKLARGEVQMLGTSGTVTTLSGMRQNLPRYDRSAVDGSSLDLDDVRALCASLLAQNWAARAAQPCIGSERADLVLAGCAILEGILALWPVPRLRVADRGLREGILINLMRQAAVGRGHGWQ